MKPYINRLGEKVPRDGKQYHYAAYTVKTEEVEFFKCSLFDDPKLNQSIYSPDDKDENMITCFCLTRASAMIVLAELLEELKEHGKILNYD